MCYNPQLEPYWNTLSALEPLMEPLLEPTFVRFWSFFGIQHSVCPSTTSACFELRTLMGTHTVHVRHPKRVHIVVAAVPKGGGGLCPVSLRRGPLAA